MSNQVNHPPHYNSGKFEVIEVIEDQKLGFHLGNSVKYILRAGKKDPSKTVEDLNKAIWYINRHLENLKESPRRPNDMNVRPTEGLKTEPELEEDFCKDFDIKQDNNFVPSYPIEEFSIAQLVNYVANHGQGHLIFKGVLNRLLNFNVFVVEDLINGVIQHHPAVVVKSYLKILKVPQAPKD